MASRQSRRVLEVRGVALSALKNHPTLDDSEMIIKQLPMAAKSTTSSLQTDSSFSSSADDFELDRESNELIQQMFIDIDSLLYDEKPVECKNDLVDECCLWKEKHPHYRIIGQQILPENEEGFIILPQTSAVTSLKSPLAADSPLADSSKLIVEGFQMELNSPSVYNFCSMSDENIRVHDAASAEEIIATTGSYEEMIASDGQHNSEKENSAETTFDIVKNLSDKVTGILSDRFYTNLVDKLQTLLSSYIGFVRSEMYESSKFTNLPNLRLSTAPPRNFSEMDGVLTVSSSRLQMRGEKSSSLPSTALVSPFSRTQTNLTPSGVPLKKLQAAMRLIPLEKKGLKERDCKTSSASYISYSRPITLPPIQTLDDGRTLSKVKGSRPCTLSSHSRGKIDFKLKSAKEELPVNKNPDVNK